MSGGYIPQPWQPLLISVEQAAQMLSISKTTLYDMIRYAGCPVYRFGKAIRIRPSELQEWLEKRKEQEAAE